MHLNRSLIEDCEKFVGKDLKQREDLTELLKIFADSNDNEGFEDFCFTGKYVNGLFRVLKESSGIPEAANIEQIKKDLAENLEKITAEIRKITSALNDEGKFRFENKYLQFSKESFENLKHLTEDLDHLKKYINYLKRER